MMKAHELTDLAFVEQESRSHSLRQLLPGPGAATASGAALEPAVDQQLRRVYKAAVEAAGAELAHLDLRGPHDMRHTFATWLKDATIPSPVIDELMGHAGGRHDPGAGGSPMGRVYRETTPRWWRV